MVMLPAIRRGGSYFGLRSGIDDLLRSFFANDDLPLARRADGKTLALDISETDKEIVVKADVPGVKPEDLEVSFYDGILTIKGERNEEKEEKKANYSLVERSYGSFSRSISLPSYVDPADI